jgi:hypothetical protein
MYVNTADGFMSTGILQLFKKDFSAGFRTALRAAGRGDLRRIRSGSAPCRQVLSAYIILVRKRKRQIAANEIYTSEERKKNSICSTQN